MATEERRLARERILIARLFDYFHDMEVQRSDGSIVADELATSVCPLIKKKAGTAAAIIEVASLQEIKLSKANGIQGTNIFFI